MSETQNATITDGRIRPMGGNTPQATIAFDAFQKQAIAALLNAKVNRQQARRLDRTIEKKDSTAVKRVASEISPEIQAAVESALKTKEPTKALHWLGRLVKFAAIAGMGLFATLAGVNDAIDLIERLDGDRPIDQIIKDLRKKEPQEENSEETSTIADGGKESQLNNEKED